MAFLEEFNWNYLIWPLALYGAVNLIMFFAGLTFHQILKRFSSASSHIASTAVHDNQRSMLDVGRVITDNLMIISVLCSNRDKAGGHAFLIFEYKPLGHDSITYYRADFRLAEPLESNPQSLSQLSAGEPKISVIDTMNRGKVEKWLERGQEYQSFKYEFHDEESTIKKIKQLEDTSDSYTYSLLGNHSSTSVNSKPNNQNCATWCAEVLKEVFQIDLGMESWKMIRSPTSVVQNAKKTQLDEKLD